MSIMRKFRIEFEPEFNFGGNYWRYLCINISYQILLTLCATEYLQQSREKSADYARSR